MPPAPTARPPRPPPRIWSRGEMDRLAETCCHFLKPFSCISARRRSAVVTTVNAAVSKAAVRHNLYVDETMQSFFRRLDWTPDGAFLLTPAGLYQTEKDSPQKFVCYAFDRHEFETPAAALECGDKPSVAVRCSPFKYALPAGRSKSDSGSLASYMPEVRACGPTPTFPLSTPEVF